MIRRYYADVLDDDSVQRVFYIDDPDEGPPTPPTGNGTPQYLGTDFVWNAPSDTAKPTWPAGATAIVWVETAALGDLVMTAIGDIDSAADAARLNVLSRPTNSEEYRQAESQARDFKAAGYPAGQVPEDVDSWAAAKYRDGWTAQQAADDIITTADAWRGLLSSIRRLRLVAKEDVRHASTGAEITARIETFKTDLANLMKGLA